MRMVYIMRKFRKMLGVLYFTTCFALLFTRSAHAYIDPSVTTYAIQAIAGVAIAAGTFVAIYWRRAKKKVSKVLGIDETAKKKMEEEVVEFNLDDKSSESK